MSLLSLERSSVIHRRRAFLRRFFIWLELRHNDVVVGVRRYFRRRRFSFLPHLLVESPIGGTVGFDLRFCKRRLQCPVAICPLLLKYSIL